MTLPTMPSYTPLRPAAEWSVLAQLLPRLVREGVLAEFDRHWVELLARLYPAASPARLLTAALLRAGVDQGHVCLDLRELAGRWPAMAAEAGVAFPGPGALQDELARWPLVRVAEAGEARDLAADSTLDALADFAVPLVLVGQRLYLKRYWRYEQELAADIRRRAVKVALPEAALPPGRLDELAATVGVSLHRDQRAAVLGALKHQLTVISGGPGTGKTTIVFFILTLLTELAACRQNPLPRVLLLAPTGKAAARLAESLGERRADFTAMTIHRALGYQPDSPASFRHDRQHPLAADLVVVDEASMVDMALMSKLFAAVPPGARLVLLGDKDQLASVEAGSILGDICLAAPSLNSAVIELNRGFRFDPQRGIGALVRAIKAGDPAAVLAVPARLQRREEGEPDEGPPAVTLSDNAEAAANRELERVVMAGFRPCLTAVDPAQALARLADFRLLCAHRRGRYGVEQLNNFCRQLLVAAGLLESGEESYYRGRPVLIVANSYQDQLFNGDLGIIWPSAADDDELMAFFPAAGGEPRRLPLGRLPRHETAFAMTIHKSQGSEFDQVAVLLPGEDSPLLSRELLYTAVSRARSRVHLFASEGAISRAIGRRVSRTSGLAEALGAA